jgi:miniconductance mechanosensitive channel
VKYLEKSYYKSFQNKAPCGVLYLLYSNINFRLFIRGRLKALIEFLRNLLVEFGLRGSLSLYLSYIASALIIVIISFLVDMITKRFILRALKTYIKISKTRWDDVFLEKKVFHQLAHIPAVVVLYIFAPIYPDYQTLLQRFALSYIIYNIARTMSKALDAIDDIYREHEVSKVRPIKGYLQVVKIFVYTTAVIVVFSVIIDRSPWILLSGIGAATAVLLLIFQNTILGLVASIQLVTNNMIQIGDWIEVPSQGADGAVTDISLHTVKVQNWDNTIVTLPTHSLISGAFKNWRGMQESGGRRIKRSIYIDMNSIKFCDEEMLERYKKIQCIEEYIQNKIEEVDRYNEENNIDESSIVNGRHLTNIGTFRVYVENYLKNHPRINTNLLQIVRQLQPNENGLPIEIYAFTKETAWVAYEAIQSDIFDHILAIVPEFNLRIFQKPAGHDFEKIKSNK